MLSLLQPSAGQNSKRMRAVYSMRDVQWPACGRLPPPCMRGQCQGTPHAQHASSIFLHIQCIPPRRVPPSSFIVASFSSIFTELGDNAKYINFTKARNTLFKLTFALVFFITILVQYRITSPDFRSKPLNFRPF